MPSTPPEVLVEIRKTSSEAAEKIREGEALCAKDSYDVATIYGALLKYDTSEKIKRSAQEVDEKINAAKA